MKKSIVIASLLVSMTSQIYASSEELHKNFIENNYGSFFEVYNKININNKENNSEAKIENFSDGEIDGFDDEFTETQNIFDPLSGYNEIMTGFNDVFYTDVLIPVVRTYRDIVHEDIRTGVSNVFDNLLFPVRFINNVLQLKFSNATEELGRFVLNSTLGLLGIFDIGTKAGLQEHDEDFGQTLGYYGVGSGFHIVLPFLGPSNFRDMFGLAADSYANPLSANVGYEPYQIPHNSLEGLGYQVVLLVNDSSFTADEYLELKKDAIELYPFLRDVYEQNREKLIKE